MSKSRVIVSMDFPDKEACLLLAERLNPAECRLKIGKELFTLEGPSLLEALMQKDFEIFLDLKYHDIPNTVAGACRAAAELGVWMLNVHASGGSKMMLAAREAVDKSNQSPLLIAVTVLTSMSADDLKELHIQQTPEQQVVALASLAKQSGIDGVVCSAQEAKILSNQLGKDFCLVTPGIRPAGSSQDDQQRIMTPAKAIAAGSHYLVIGRPITRAEDPQASLEAILQEIATI